MSVRPFLTAEWRHLVLFSWRVDPAVLVPLVPRGTVLDSWDGACYVSLVGFLCLRTRLLGLPIPLHRDFEEINLRFYVRRTVGADVRRGVCFIRELVPRRAIALTARLAYNEPYRAMPMAHRIEPGQSSTDPSRVEYAWRAGAGWSRIVAAPAGIAAPVLPDSHEQFITEHYWGYTRQRDGGTIEYNVVHPPWRVRQVPEPQLEGDLAATYGTAFARILRAMPESALLADGSPVAVHRPARIASVHE